MAVSFWNVDGEDVTKSEIKEQDNSFKPLPENWYQGLVDKIEVKDGDYGKSIRATLSCKVGNDMKKTSISLKCWDQDTKKRKRAIQMLVLLFRVAGKDLPRDEPSDENLQAIVGKKMGFKIGLYEMTTDDGKELSGNWLQYVGTSQEAKEKATAPKEEVKKPAPSAPPAMGEQEDDIPW